MRLSIVWGLIGLVGAAALAWGWSVGGESVAARPSDLTTAVPAAWYADLPLDAAAATDAYLARVPPRCASAAKDIATLECWPSSCAS